MPTPSHRVPPLTRRIVGAVLTTSLVMPALGAGEPPQPADSARPAIVTGPPLASPVRDQPLQAFPEGRIVVVRDDAWTNLFDRQSGWTGADGIYCFARTGIDRNGAAADTQTFFVFSDTAIGEVGPDNKRQPGTTLVNNTVAVLDGGVPDPARIRFLWGRTSANKPAAIAIPRTPQSQPDDWFWFGDGLVLEDDLHLVGYRMRSNGQGGVFGFETAGVALITFDLTAAEPWKAQTQVDAPLFIAATEENGDITYGAGILPNTEAAQAPFPDGYIYVYGVRNDISKKLLAARVEPQQFTDFSAWRFYDGVDWVADIHAAAPLTNRVSNELSVTPLPSGEYLLVYQQDGIGDRVAIRRGATPVGPWSPSQSIYLTPEPGSDPDTFVYNAKAHPHISPPGELLISYNVNTFDFFGDFFNNADIYRPRFIRLSVRP